MAALTGPVFRSYADAEREADARAQRAGVQYSVVEDMYAAPLFVVVRRTSAEAALEENFDRWEIQYTSGPYTEEA